MCISDSMKALQPGMEKTFLMRGFDITNRAVYEKSTSDPEMQGMGTTGVCAYASRGMAHVVHAGDSRAYQMCIRDRVCGVFTRRDKPVGRKQILTAPPVKQLAVEHGLLPERGTWHAPFAHRTEICL